LPTATHVAGNCREE